MSSLADSVYSQYGICAIGRVRLFVGVFAFLCILNRLTLVFCVRLGHDHTLRGIEIQGHRSRSAVKVNVCATRLLRCAMSID